MRIAADLFSQILEMSLTASVVIAAILLIRGLMTKLPKKYSYYLWAVVLFRLVCPLSVSSALSIFNLGGYEWKRLLGLTDAFVSKESVLNPDLSVTTYAYTEDVIAYEYTPSTVDFLQAEIGVPIWLQIASLIWLVGIVVILFYSIYTYFKFRKVVSKATLLRENVYECENIPSPFVMGIFEPKIYIPYHLSKEEQDYVLAHEKYHIKRCDHIVKITAFLVLAIYWFHPLVWVSFFFACRDMEMSCDEKVLSLLGNDIKQDYSMLLLSFATNKRLSFAGPLAFGESDTGKRVKNVLRFRQPRVWASVLGIILVAIVALGCATDEDKEAVVAGTNTETAKIDIYDELENVQIEGVPIKSADVIRHDYSGNVESANPEELSFIQDWAVAFCNRDGKAIYEMASEESREMLADSLLLEEHNGEYSFGWSSPWPMNANADWRITSMEEGKAVVLYYAWTSDPHITVWRSEVSYAKVDGRFQCTPDAIQFMDAIDSEESFFKAYPQGNIQDTQMDYLTNGMGEALNENAKSNRDTMPLYEALFAPETAVRNLLNLSENVQTYVRAYAGKDGVDTDAYVRVLFSDGYMTIIKMQCPFGDDGIWIPQTLLTEDEFVVILEEKVEEEVNELKYFEESLSEDLLPHQPAMAP